MKNTGIYKLTSPENKVYIGRSVDLRYRYTNFFGKQHKPYAGRLINEAREKYPDFSLWKYDILEYCDKDDLDNREKYWISYYKSDNSEFGYNITKGGQSGTEYGKKMPLTEKQIISLTHRDLTGSNNGMYGKHHTESARRKIAEAHKGVKMPYESKVKQGKKINQYSLSGEFIKTYNMLSEAAESIGVTSSAIYLACRGKIKTAVGFKWSYCDN